MISMNGVPALFGLALLVPVATLGGGDDLRPPSSPESRAVAPGDPISELQARIDAGDIELAFDSVRGYLPALLEALEVPFSSQTLVFSRTSLQTDRIAPWAPRALYFNDDVYVGWVQESPFLEIASIHPIAGTFFFSLPQREVDRPQFERQGTTCLMCHESRSMTGGVAGLLMTSVLADRLGYPSTVLHEGNTTERTPFEVRWGGWYVSGTHEGFSHAGNARSPDLNTDIQSQPGYLEGFDLNSAGNATDLRGQFDVTPYLSEHSDIVALMVLTHQVLVHNLISLVRDEGVRDLGGPTFQKGGSREANAAASAPALDRLVRAILFVGEPALRGPVHGPSGFTEEFSALGPTDAQGRSLRDFDLQTRMFRYPLSFLVYSDAFDALPEFARNEIYRQLAAILVAEHPPVEFQHISADDRGAIFEILQATKPEFRTWIGELEAG